MRADTTRISHTIGTLALPRWLWLLAGGLALYALAVGLDLPKEGPDAWSPVTPWWGEIHALRGWGPWRGGWAWALIDPAPLLRWLPILGCGLLGAVALWTWERREVWRVARIPWAPLAGLVVLGIAMQLSAFWLRHPNANQLLFDRITNPNFTGYFTAATTVHDPGRFFGGYADFIGTIDVSQVCSHCRTHPPGPILFYWLPLQAVAALPLGVQQALRDGLTGLLQITPGARPPAETVVAILGGYAVLLGAALIVVPLYGLARRLAGSRYALPLAALGAILPGLVLMSPEFDQMYATFAATLLYVALCGLSAPRRPLLWGAGTGLLLTLGLYWSFGLLVLIGPLLALAALAATVGVAPGDGPQAMRPLPWRAVGAWLGGLAVATLVPWALLWGSGFDLPQVLEISREDHIWGNVGRRPYLPWLGFNLVDFFQFLGLALVGVSLLTVAWRAAPFRGPAPTNASARPGWWTRLQAWAIAHLNLYGLLFWITLLILNLSGTTRAEVGRLWLFLTPLALLGIYYAARAGRVRGPHLAALLAGQFVVCLLIGGRWSTP